MRTALTDMLGLDEELSWLDAVTHGRPYGVDVLIPTQLAGRDEGLSADETAARVPAEHVEFARDLLLRYGVILTACIGPVNSQKDVNDGSAAQSGYRRNIRVPVPE